MRKLLVIGLVFFSMVSLGQNVGGIVYEGEEPIPSVVIIENGRNLTVTGADGSFELTLSTGTHTLEFHHPGYQTAEREVVVDSRNTSGHIRVTVTMKPASTTLGSVVVSAGRYEQRTEESPISVDVLDPYLITERVQSEIKETIQQASGVNVTDGHVNIRSGSGWSYGAGTRVLVLVDEMPLISPDAGQAQWSLVPTEAVDQMEILKGAASSLYGTSAMNGIVNVRTIRPTDEPATDIRLYQGVFDSPARRELKWWDGIRGWTGVQFNHTFKSGKQKEFGWVVAGQAEHDAGFQYEVPDHRARLLGKFTYRNPEKPDWEYELLATGLWSETGDALLWNGYNETLIPLDSQATRTVGYDLFVDPKVTYRGHSGVHILRGRFMMINNNARSESTDYANYSRMGYAEYMWQRQFGALKLVSGVSGQYGRSNSEIFGGLHTISDEAIYVQADYNLSWITFTGGVRYEALQLDDNSWSRPVKRFGFNGGGEYTRFRASYGEGFRFPSMAETYTRTNVGALQVFPNYDLRPENGWSAEVGGRQLFGFGKLQGYADAALFLMRYENMMEFSFGRWGSGGATPFEEFGFRSINVGDTEVRGIELSTFLEYTVSGGIHLKWMGGITWMDPRPLDPEAVYGSYPGLFPGSPDQELSYQTTSSNPESGVLKYRYRRLFKSDLQVDLGSWSFGTSIRHNDFMANVDQIFIDPVFSQFIPGVADAREAQPSGDWIIDVRIKYEVNEMISVSFISGNVTNREYYPRPALAASPRTFALQLRYKI